jgi:hypothetical protein
MRDVTHQAEVMEFSVQWIAEKAKNHVEAANLLLELIFRAHSFTRKKIVRYLTKAVRCLPYLPKSIFPSLKEYRKRCDWHGSQQAGESPAIAL